MRSFATGLFLISAALAEFKTPPVQTAVQKDVTRAQAAKAKVASDAATADVVAFFEGNTFRAGLKQCCPTVADLPSVELLARFRAEVRAAELAHTFPSGFGKSHFKDITIPVASQHDWFLNEWQAPILNNETGDIGYNVAEENVFGCPSFKNDSQPTWEEAADRLIYIAHNMRQLDTGSLPTFGDVAAIFRKSYVYHQVLMAAIDTGMYEMSCNKTAYPNASYRKHLNCTAMTLQVGTLDHFDHIILSNLAVWSNAFNRTVEEQAIDLFNRTSFAGDYLNLPPTNMNEGLTYYEANILANPRLPEGVSFLIGSMTSLFGTDAGRELQLLADHYSWPLVWALGAPTMHWEQGRKASLLAAEFPSPTYAGNGRILDPEVLSTESLNVTVSSRAKDGFLSMWTAVAERRKNVVPITQSEWSTYFANLSTSQVRLAPITASAGCDDDKCIGTTAVTSQCVCKRDYIVVV